MIYPSNFESKIGFDVIRNMLTSRCISYTGQTFCSEMSFMTSFHNIHNSLLQVSETKSMIEAATSLPLNAHPDISQWLLHLKIPGSHISEESFQKLATLISDTEKLAALFSSDTAKEKWPKLTHSFAQLPQLTDIRKKITDIISEHATVKDTASENLYRIRKEKAAAAASVSGMMKRIVDKNIASGVVAIDTKAAIRDGRLVIPVDAALKRKIPGIVHDQSASGKTYFIEPAEIVEANNRLRELNLQEKKEIIIILTALADTIRPRLDDIAKASNELGRFDFIHAKAKLALDMDAQLPNLSAHPEMEWYHAIHPVLFFSLKRQKREIVPLDITLNKKHRILLISGPNAGGKSVTLKTVAIVQYMMQCGLLPPLYSNSHMGIFHNLFIDIGDEQSIENDLSTYSSHLRNMTYFLRHANAQTLFLADEMGSGTEPQIGGAIAQAIIGKLNQCRAYGVVTTHYQNLKSYANSTPGLINGAMLYDRNKLQPLFKLAIGSPGSSFAIDIARKSGLPVDVINNAKELVGTDYVNSDKYLLDLTRDKNYWASKRLSIKEKEIKYSQLIEDVTQKASEIKSKRAEIINEARREAKEILAKANSKIENAIKEIRIAEAEKVKTKEVRQQLEDYRKAVMSAEDDIGEHKLLNIGSKKRDKNGNNQSPTKRQSEVIPIKKSDEVISIGDYVKLKQGDAKGYVLAVKGNKVEIAIGELRSLVEKNKLQKLPKPTQPSALEKKSSISTTTVEASRQRQLNFKNEIDLRGFRVDEALQAVTYFIDDAIQFGASRIRILHGTGTGALKIAIRQFLQANHNVTSFHDEDVRLGGAGITVVNLE